MTAPPGDRSEMPSPYGDGAGWGLVSGPRPYLRDQPGQVLAGATAHGDLQDLRVLVRVHRLQLRLGYQGQLGGRLEEQERLVLTLQAPLPMEERGDQGDHRAAGGHPLLDQRLAQALGLGSIRGRDDEQHGGRGVIAQRGARGRSSQTMAVASARPPASSPPTTSDSQWTPR